MNTLVVYQSGTGFTKQYAEWIAHGLNCEVKSIKKVNPAEVQGYDRIIYGGWILGNMIMGLNKIKKMGPKQLVVFAVGASKAEEQIINKITETNQLSDLPFYYMIGGFHYEKLGFMKKMMLNMVKKSIAKKETKTEQDIYMEQLLGSSVDYSDIDYTDQIIQDMKERS